MQRFAVLLVVLLSAGCVDTERDYRPAGFESRSQVVPYVSHNLYLASKLTDAEWKAFYKRFPAYWKDIEQARQLGSTINYHPWYTAYAFRWTTLKTKRPSWPPAIRTRLEQGRIAPGDDPFKLFYAIGAPKRILWDNDFEILIYSEDRALILSDGVYAEARKCPGCLPWEAEEPENYEILRAMKLERPEY